VPNVDPIDIQFHGNRLWRFNLSAKEHEHLLGLANQGLLPSQCPLWFQIGL
jgi:hypothetical protein